MAPRTLGVVAGLESPDSPHCLDWVSIPNTSERLLFMGAPSHPLDGQTARGLRTTWLAAYCPSTTQCCDQGTLHTSLTPQAGLWLSWFSWLPWGGGDMEGAEGADLHPALWLPANHL